MKPLCGVFLRCQNKPNCKLNVLLTRLREERKENLREGSMKIAFNKKYLIVAFPTVGMGSWTG
jgi:hypothetical protein